MSEMPFGYEMLQDPDFVYEFMQDVNRMMKHNFELVQHVHRVEVELSQIREAAFEIAYFAGKGKHRIARRKYRKLVRNGRSWQPILLT